uniref:Uncharacterized protein n=1 Tax=Setaria viridis TaxID=4556 RepID=A0A4U6TSR6_SETVI|nr:hypothetical protein SEVIR_7G088500v2 [Setaria viridis]
MGVGEAVAAGGKRKLERCGCGKRPKDDRRGARRPLVFGMIAAVLGDPSLPRGAPLRGPHLPDLRLRRGDMGHQSVVAPGGPSASVGRRRRPGLRPLIPGRPPDVRLPAQLSLLQDQPERHTA